MIIFNKAERKCHSCYTRYNIAVQYRPNVLLTRPAYCAICWDHLADYQMYDPRSGAAFAALHVCMRSARINA